MLRFVPTPEAKTDEAKKDDFGPWPKTAVIFHPHDFWGFASIVRLGDTILCVIFMSDFLSEFREACLGEDATELPVAAFLRGLRQVIGFRMCLWTESNGYL